MMIFARSFWVSVQATQKVLVGGPKPKSCKSPGSNSSTTSSHSTAVKEANAILIDQQRLEIQETRHMIEEQRRFSEMQSKQMEEMMKKIEELSGTLGGSCDVRGFFILISFSMSLFFLI